jgi:hypothetical protein
MFSSFFFFSFSIFHVTNRVSDRRMVTACGRQTNCSSLLTEKALVVMASPNDVLQVVVMHNFSNKKGEVVPTRYKLGSWVTLRPDRSKRRRGRRRCSGGVLQDWKAQVVNFTMEVRDADGAFAVGNVLVRHAYESRQVADLDPNVQQPKRPCNCELLSFYIEALRIVNIVFAYFGGLPPVVARVERLLQVILIGFGTIVEYVSQKSRTLGKLQKFVAGPSLSSL